jgi:hypothetical protein
MEPYEKFLEALPSEVSFGYETIRVYRPPELASLQVGYSISLTGESLTGDKDGDWRRNWVAIGQEELCGDPIFIDTSEKGFPVFTAAHGEGRWDAKRIAISLEAFGRALSAIGDVAKGRENPVALEKNPLTKSEREATLGAIRGRNPGVDLEFWEIILGIPE